MTAHECWPGRAYPLGATFDGAGTNFSLFSEVVPAGVFAGVRQAAIAASK